MSTRSLANVLARCALACASAILAAALPACPAAGVFLGVVASAMAGLKIRMPEVMEAIEAVARSLRLNNVILRIGLFRPDVPPSTVATSLGVNKSTFGIHLRVVS